MPKTFDNLAQRGVNYFLATVPSFRAVSSDAATEREQESAYSFIKGVYEKIYADPTLLGLKIAPDDCFEDWWPKKSTKPGLDVKIRGYIKNINMFVEALFGTAFCEAYEMKSVMQKKLAAFGVTPEQIAKDPGLKLLAEISNSFSENSATEIHKNSVLPHLLFSRGVFDPVAPYTAEIFHNIFENKEAFDKLNDYFAARDFVRVDNRADAWIKNGCNVSLDYVKLYGNPEGVIGAPWKSRNYSGVSFEYNELIETCATVGIHIPFYREVLAHTDEMSESLRAFISSGNKCFHCGYCVQMDKTKTKPMKFVTVNDTDLCSLFTGGYKYKKFYGEMWLTNGIIELMDFVDKLFLDKRL